MKCDVCSWHKADLPIALTNVRFRGQQRTISPSSHRTQIIRHLAEFLDHLGVAEIAVAGSPVRLNATAPTRPSLRDSASRITTAAGLKHSVGSPAAMPSSVATNGSATQ